jgi:hypothetical protein
MYRLSRIRPLRPEIVRVLEGRENGTRMGNGVEMKVTPYAHTLSSPLGDRAHSSGRMPVRPELVPFVQKRFGQWHGCGNGASKGKGVEMGEIERFSV